MLNVSVHNEGERSFSPPAMSQSGPASFFPRLKNVPRGFQMRRDVALDVPDEAGRCERRPSRSVHLVLKLPIEVCPYL